jgi:hypothetical protein
MHTKDKKNPDMLPRRDFLPVWRGSLALNLRVDRLGWVLILIETIGGWLSHKVSGLKRRGSLGGAYVAIIHGL